VQVRRWIRKKREGEDDGQVNVQQEMELSFVIVVTPVRRQRRQLETEGARRCVRTVSLVRYASTLRGHEYHHIMHHGLKLLAPSTRGGMRLQPTCIKSKSCSAALSKR